MKHFAETLKNVESTNKKAEKLEHLKGLSQTAQTLLWNLFNPYRVFHVRKWQEPEAYAKKDIDHGETFNFLLEQLHAKQLRGNAARDAVSETLGKYTAETASYLTRVLQKDASAGFSGDTLNKIYPNLIPSFSVMLAEKVDENYEFVFPCMAEVKYDGLRCITMVENGTVTHYSRSGLIHFHLEGLFDDELIALEKIIGHPYVLDSEVMGESFKSALNAKSKSKGGEAKKAQRLYCFDIMSLTAWNEKKCTAKQIERSALVESLIQELSKIKPGHKLVKSQGSVMASYKQIKEFFDRVIAAGGEGLVIKTLDGVYVWDRDPAWTKWKGVIDLDLQITGFYPGRKGSRLANTLGGVYLAGEDENGRYITTKCGSGFSDDLRNEIWNNQDKYMGVTCKIEAGEISESKGKFSARWGIFCEFRFDK